MLSITSRLLILLSFLSISVNANDLWKRYQFVNLSVPSPSNVNTLYEDQLGQIWVGTDSGLYRIQNNKIQKVSHAPKSEIEDMMLAGDNDILLASSNGVWQWHSQTNNFTTFTCTEEQSFKQLINHPTLGLIALARSGIYQLSENQTCRKILLDGLPENTAVERLAMLNETLILAVRHHGLFQCSAKCNNIQSFGQDFSATRIREIVTTSNMLYIGTHKHGFYALNNQGKVKRHWHRNADLEPDDLSLPVNGVMSILPTQHSIWAGLWAGGLQQFDAQSGRKISSSRFYEPDTSTIGGKHIRALLESKNGTLYVGHENGVSIILSSFNQQGWIGLENDYQGGFTHDNIFSLYHLNDTWFTGTSSGGLYRIGHTENKFLRMSPDSPAPFNLPTKSIWQIIPSQRGDLVLGTANGVISLNPNTLDWRVIGDTTKLASSDVYSLTEAPDQTLWLSLWEGGIARLNREGQLIGQWSQDDGLQQNTSTVITSTANNQIFALNDNGLFRYSSQQDKFVVSSLQNKQNNCSEVNHISTDRKIKLWALCQHNNLWRLEKENWINVSLATSDPILQIFSPLSDHNSTSEHLFLLTKNHVFALGSEGQLIWKKPRLVISNIAVIHQVIIIEDELITATNKGLYRQKLSQPYQNPLQPSPIISGIRLFNKPLEIEPKSENSQLIESTALYQGQLKLNYEQDLITFEFAIPGYHHEPIPGFNYRLVPFDKQWLTTAEDETKASYTRLPPGDYHFEVKSIAANEQTFASFQLAILPPWYLTWWAKSLAIIALIAFIFALILSRTRRLNQRNLWLQESVEARTAELEEANSKLQQVANLDALTGLLNRRGFRNRCAPNWAQWQDSVMLMIADIDHFKQVNDQYGHQLGDEVLVSCAQRLTSKAEKQDLIARWGGEEFLILLKAEPADSQESLLLRAQQMQAVIGETIMELSSENITITMTAGICIHHGQDFETCLQQADQKLYDGKNSGRNRLIS